MSEYSNLCAQALWRSLQSFKALFAVAPVDDLIRCKHSSQPVKARLKSVTIAVRSVTIPSVTA